MPQPATPSNAFNPDTIGADSLAIDSNALQLSPQYLSGFPDSTTCDTTVTSMSTLPLMTPPDGREAQPLASGLLHDSVCMALLLAGVMAVVVTYRTGYKYMENFVHNMFSTRRRENLFEDHTMSETRILSALMANTCIVEGLLLFMAVDIWKPTFSASLHAAIAVHALLFIGIALLFYLVQLGVYTLIGNVFTDSVNTRIWTAGFNATQSLLGLLLLPLLAVALVVPESAKQMLIFAIILYFCARIVFICKGFRIFFSTLPSLVYFILYLCAVEFVPIFLLAAATVYFCNLLQ